MTQTKAADLKVGRVQTLFAKIVEADLLRIASIARTNWDSEVYEEIEKLQERIREHDRQLESFDWCEDTACRHSCMNTYLEKMRSEWVELGGRHDVDVG